jgi:hypothetical protein
MHAACDLEQLEQGLSLSHLTLRRAQAKQEFWFVGGIAINVAMFQQQGTSKMSHLPQILNSTPGLEWFSAVGVEIPDERTGAETAGPDFQIVERDGSSPSAYT